MPHSPPSERTSSTEAKYNRLYLESLNGDISGRVLPRGWWKWALGVIIALVIMALAGCKRDETTGWVVADKTLADKLCHDAGGVSQYIYTSNALIYIQCKDQTYVRFEKS